MLKNIGLLVKQLKNKLPDYLEDKGIKTQGKLFKCPNKEEHKNGDLKPSANFYPDKRSWHCFACSYKNKLGDIFDAVNLLEGKDITGENFFEAIKYLCNKFAIPFEETSTEEEAFIKEIRSYLEELTAAASKNLKAKMQSNKELMNILTKKGWINSIDKFRLGFLDTPYKVPNNKDVLAYLNLDPKLLVNRLLIPIYDSRGYLVGITARILEVDTKSTDFKYKHFISSSLQRLLFNAHKVDGTKEVVVVEGPSSVLTLNALGVTNVVATFGNLMREKQYEILVKKKAKDIFFMYDGDAGGLEGLRNSLSILCKGDLEVKIGILEDGLDPADYLIQNKTFEKVKVMPLLNYLLDSYAGNTEDKLVEKSLITYVSGITDLVKKEHTVNQIAKHLKITKSTIQDLIAIYSQGNNVSVANVLKERDSLVNVLNDYEKWSWSRGKLLGLKSFKSFDAKLNGIQNGLIMIGGEPNIGKSALLISLVMLLLQRNDNMYLLYFTIDDPIFTTVSRFVANHAALPINVVGNPNYNIMKANLPAHIKQDYANRREKALTFLRERSSFINLKDVADASTIEQVEDTIKNIAPLTQGKQLVVVVDSVHNLRSNKRLGERQLYEYISNKLNKIANTYKCPVIASAHITKSAIKDKQYDGTAFKETVEFFFDSKLMIMVATDDTVDETRDDLELKLLFVKNKMSSFRGALPMMFYRSWSQVKELFTNTKQQEKNLFE